MARIQPGLERIAALLKGIDFPWRSIHVAGTNGKGSICHYASSMLVGKTVSVGKFTSPHLVDRCVLLSVHVNVSNSLDGTASPSMASALRKENST